MNHFALAGRITNPTNSIGKKLGIAGGVLVLSAAALGVGRVMQCQQFTDLPGASENDFGRTVNGLSSVLAGIVAQKISPNSTFSMTIEKPMYADAPISGKTTTESVQSRVELSLTSAQFTGTTGANGISGTVDKSEFDWSIRQSGPNTWEVGRFGLKFDATLKLHIENGTINGVYERGPLSFNWNISGRYTTEGLVNIEVQTGFINPNFKIVGKVAPQ
jgi:hypothetical protein